MRPVVASSSMERAERTEKPASRTVTTPPPPALAPRTPEAASAHSRRSWRDMRGARKRQFQVMAPSAHARRRSRKGCAPALTSLAHRRTRREKCRDGGGNLSVGVGFMVLAVQGFSGQDPQDVDHVNDVSTSAPVRPKSSLAYAIRDGCELSSSSKVRNFVP